MNLHGTPVKAGDIFTLHKMRGCRASTAVCALFSHPSGWELQLTSGEEFQRSQVCRTRKEWLDTAEAWKAALIDSGWA